MPVTLTETAAREINRIIHEQGLDPAKVRLRVGVKGGGCAGFSYILDLTETQKDTDETWEYSFTTKPAKVTASVAAVSNGGGVAVAEGNGSQGEPFTIAVVCDQKSYIYLGGTSIDFRDEVMGRGFVFNNPNQTSSCGCGSSFSA